MLDNKNLLKQRDPSDTLGAMSDVSSQALYDAVVVDGEKSTEPIQNIILAGMGGSALAADMVQVLTRGWLHVPIQVTKSYDLPGCANKNTLVIAISHSGNTEETLSCYEQAIKSCQVAAMSTGGKLIDLAKRDNAPHVVVPSGAQPRMSTVYHLRALLKILQHFEIIDSQLYDEMAKGADWLNDEIKNWSPDVPESENYAKQIAQELVGKTQVFHGGELTWPIAYKWKISFNESAKNVAFWNQYPEFNHNEFIGWTSHPIEKQFAVVDFYSSLERPRISERMELSDRLLSGMRPKAMPINLRGETLLQQFLWGLALADMASIYTGILNNQNPEPVELVERLKKELS